MNIVAALLLQGYRVSTIDGVIDIFVFDIIFGVFYILYINLALSIYCYLIQFMLAWEFTVKLNNDSYLIQMTCINQNAKI